MAELSSFDPTEQYDVLLVGGGNAALCAAIAARREGASVLVLEGASKFYRSGNTRHTRNIRCTHNSATETLTGPYSEDELFEEHLGGVFALFLTLPYGKFVHVFYRSLALGQYARENKAGH